MSNRLHQLILTLAVTGVAAGAWSQSAPDPGAGGAGPDGAEHPMHGWHGDDGEHGAHKRWDDNDGEHHRHHRHHGGWGERGDGDGERGAASGMAFRGLNLTPDQRQKMRVIVMTARLQTMQQAGTQKPGGAGDRAALINPGDPNYHAAVEAAKKRAVDRIQHMSDLKLQLYSVLTPEQKTQLSQRVTAWKARMAQAPNDTKGPPAPAAR